MANHQTQHGPKSKIVALGLTIAGLGLLTACGSEGAQSESFTQAPSASPSRQAGNLGTRVCINNSTGREITIDITKADTGNGQTSMANNSRACAEGTFAFSNIEVSGVIDKDGETPLLFEANNPALEPPTFGIRNDSYCLKGPTPNFEVNKSKDITTPTLKMQITRKPDGQWKNFEVYLTNGDGTSIQHTQRECVNSSAGALG